MNTPCEILECQQCRMEYNYLANGEEGHPYLCANCVQAMEQGLIGCTYDGEVFVMAN